MLGFSVMILGVVFFTGSELLFSKLYNDQFGQNITDIASLDDLAYIASQNLLAESGALSVTNSVKT
jgi:hypothetical protein